MKALQIIIIGGGAAGFFAAINAAQNARINKKKVQIQILEASDNVLKKVRISGGGRCNVTHHQFDVRRFCANYPRGSKELLSAMQRFQARDTVEWFQKYDVHLLAEADGRMFPSTNDSETIIQCFLNASEKLGIQLKTNSPVTQIRKQEDGTFLVHTKEGDPLIADKIMLVTGSSQQGHRLAKELGHTITELAPSLFSFKITDPLLQDLSGLSFPLTEVKLNIPGEKVFAEKGPLLITHWGLSGPAVLKISAWAAREMMHAQYKAELTVNWLGDKNFEQTNELVKTLKEQNPKMHVGNIQPDGLAKRFWLKLLDKWQIPQDKKWADLTKKDTHTISQGLFATSFQVLGKNRYKDEFVECGGVALNEVNFKSMESKVCPGLYLAGEILDVDGITGGFNFQNAWTGAWIAAQSMIKQMVE